MASEKAYDFIIAGGGLSGCVVASRLKEYKPEADILLIEAGEDTRARADILRPEVLNLGTDLDWTFPTEPAPGIGGRTLVYNAGKGLGGGTLINSGTSHCTQDSCAIVRASFLTPIGWVAAPNIHCPCSHLTRRLDSRLLDRVRRVGHRGGRRPLELQGPAPLDEEDRVMV